MGQKVNLPPAVVIKDRDIKVNNFNQNAVIIIYLSHKFVVAFSERVDEWLVVLHLFLREVLVQLISN